MRSGWGWVGLEGMTGEDGGLLFIRVYLGLFAFVVCNR